jgi:hypothetical protein
MTLPIPPPITITFTWEDEQTLRADVTDPNLAEPVPWWMHLAPAEYPETLAAYRVLVARGALTEWANKAWPTVAADSALARTSRSETSA